LWYLSGIRIGAFVTLPIKAVDLENRSIKLWPSLGVKTKFEKHHTAYLLEIPELLELVFNWDYKIRKVFKTEYPWFTPFSPLTLDFDPEYQSIGKQRSDRARRDLKEWLNKVDLH
jgi:hypothetical protein